MDDVRRVLIDSYRIPLRPDQGTNLWKDLRAFFEPYLRHADVGAPVDGYVDYPVNYDVEALLRSPQRRNIELEVDPSRLDATFRRSLVGIHLKNELVRDAAATVLLRLAHAHLDHESPFVIPVFQGVMTYLGKAMEGERSDECALAGHILCHTTPYVPAGFDQAPQLGEMLRFAMMKQASVLPFVWAYHGLATALLPEQTELNQGLGTFRVMASSKMAGNVQHAARLTFERLAQVRRGQAVISTPPRLYR